MRFDPILVVDDEKNILRTVTMTLKGAGYETLACERSAEAIELIESHPVSLALLDIMMPGMDGLEALARIRKIRPELTVIMMSGHGSVSSAVQATKLGAHDFLEKPLSVEKLLHTIQRALEFKRLENENRQLKSELGRGAFELIGESPVMRELREKIRMVGETHGTALIVGENGTGKELVARALHNASRRAEKPFVKVNCAAIPHELIESELFGHEKGAFTGATAMRRGKFELAHTGTIFLDEIGDMHVDVQAKALRALQEREIERVGGSKTIPVDVRVIAATNKNLKDEIERNRFRQDLFFRLNVAPIRVPSLRERREDIPMLVEHFNLQMENDYGRKRKVFTPEAIGAMKERPWPGNVRELRNFIERIYIMWPGAEVSPRALRDLTGGEPSQGEVPASHSLEEGASLKDTMTRIEADLIRDVLTESDGQVSEAARRLKLERSHLYKKIKAFGIELPEG